MNDFKALAKEMREHGVARIKYDGTYICEIELAPYVWDPPRDDLETDLAEVKRPGQCEYPGCEKPNGWKLLPVMCREHGLMSMGVQVDG